MDILLFEFFLIWSYFFIAAKKIFSFKPNIIFSIFITDISLITFVATIIMGLTKFDLFFVLASVAVTMFLINLFYDYFKRRHDIYFKKYAKLDKVKPVLDYLLIVLIISKIYY